MSRTPCYKKRIYTNPNNHTRDEIEQAIRDCHTCPMLKECATQALTSGGSLDNQRITPATGVIQAGIICRGDRDTAKQLATIAGVTLPATRHHPRFVPPHHCEGCGKPMVARDKSKPTRPDVLTHGSHGFCRICDAKRRRHPDWQSPQPRHSTVLEGKSFGTPVTYHHLDTADRSASGGHVRTA